MWDAYFEALMGFGDHPAATVTEEELQKGAQRLGIPLPEALRQFYLRVSPEDPMLRGWRLLPPKKWEIREGQDGFQHKGVTFRALLFLKQNREDTYGLVLEVRDQATGDPIDYPVGRGIFQFYRLALKEPGVVGGWLRPKGLAEQLGWGLLPTLPSLVGLVYSDQGQGALLQAAFTPLSPGSFPELWLDKAGAGILAVNGFCGQVEGQDYYTLFGANTDGPLEELMAEHGLPLRWVRSQKGHTSPDDAPTERPLYSIAPVLAFLRDFAGVEGAGASERELQRAEARLGTALPLPVREFYQYLPKELWDAYDHLRPLSRLKAHAAGGITFLTENQWCWFGALKPGSARFYIREQEGPRAPWRAVDLLDGYLAAEFATILLEAGLEMEEYQVQKEDLDPEGGRLAPWLEEIGGVTRQIAAGSAFQLFSVCGGRGVGLCEGSNRLLLMARSREEAEALGRELGLG